jgi:hypothetical protein
MSVQRVQAYAGLRREAVLSMGAIRTGTSKRRVVSLEFGCCDRRQTRQLKAMKAFDDAGVGAIDEQSEVIPSGRERSIQRERARQIRMVDDRAELQSMRRVRRACFHGKAA